MALLVTTYICSTCCEEPIIHYLSVVSRLQQHIAYNKYSCEEVLILSSQKTGKIVIILYEGNKSEQDRILYVLLQFRVDNDVTDTRGRRKGVEQGVTELGWCVHDFIKKISLSVSSNF